MKNNQIPVQYNQENSFIFNCPLSELTIDSFSDYLPQGYFFDEDIDHELVPAEISLEAATFIKPAASQFPAVSVLQQSNMLIISCSCGKTGEKLCEHQLHTLYNLLKRDNLRIFFDRRVRQDRIKKIAEDYGLENEDNLDDYFSLAYQNGVVNISPKNPSLIPVTKLTLANLQRKLGKPNSPAQVNTHENNSSLFLILKQNKYYRHLNIELVRAQISREGKPKNPFIAVNPLEEIWETGDAEIIKFFSAISRFQNNIDEKKGAADWSYLNAIISNPRALPVYFHNRDLSENVSAASIYPIRLARLSENIWVEINKKGRFFELKGSLSIEGREFSPADLQSRFGYFLQLGDDFYLVSSPAVLALAELFKGKGNTLLIHESRFREFRDTILKELDDTVAIKHKYLQISPVRIADGDGAQTDIEQILYLSDFGQHISIVPVMRYHDVEVPIRTKRQIIAPDEKGKEFIVKRNSQLEDSFTALLLKQHPDFSEQLDNPLQYFYLHKKRFLDEDWFLKAFDDWHLAGITILGFDEITENNQNPEKAKVSIQVISGLNWFNTDINVRFGKKKASIKQLQHAIKTRSRFVRLDDGTTGIIPAEWIEKFAAWFAAGEVREDSLRTPRVNFASLTDLYDEAFLSEDVKTELAEYSRRLAAHQDISDVIPPSSLLATLRPYQQHGLNWLNFLDDFNFGGCLADDMGLGKSLQIIAFILSQRTKRGMTTNMIVVPTSLIFNWLAEIEKFAPSLKVHTAYGASRTKSISEFDQYEIILTSYGTLVSDANYFKKFHFNYVFFDESQNMKNPQSQRNMAARALSSRGKIVITGTPVENNTFDLYGQLSIACPGLLGSLTHFRDVYSSPIDKFGVKKRTNELQKKVEPFILRRTKAQVAPELPEKIEMVVYCEMQPEQRQIYDAYEKEFRDYISTKTDEDLSKSSMYVLKGITRLRQICDSPALVGETSSAKTSSAKIETLISHIEDKSAGNKVLVFSQFVTMLDLIKSELEERGIPYSYLTGKTKNREAVINQFQDDPDIRVFLISLKAGGTGLNLTEASYVYIIDPWWNPAVENQAIDRCYRIGQKKNVVAVRLICPDTVEEKIMKLQQSKKGRMDDLIKLDSIMLKSMSKTDLMGLFSVPKS